MDNRTGEFVATVQASLGTNVIPIVATDLNNNRTTNQYQIVVTNTGLAKTLSYDLNGNLTSHVTATSTNTYAWDAANRLVQITQVKDAGPQLVSQFEYDGLGRRTRIVEFAGGVVQSDQRFIWAALELCEERDGTGASVTKRFFAEGATVSGSNYYFTTDHLGSVREMSDSVGAVRARYEYDPYGVRTKTAGDLEADMGFTGHYCHPASGLFLTLFRAYDPVAGRWLSRDPIAERGGLNLYAYAYNTPASLTDVLGLSACSDFANSIVSDFQRYPSTLELGKDWLSKLGTTLPDVDGFKDELVAGGQGGEVSRHVYGHGGVLMYYQSPMGLSPVGYAASYWEQLKDFRQRYWKGRTAEESRAEIADYKAARDVANLLRDAYRRRMVDLDLLRAQLEGVLCK
jgi:RHS repeat-associated protein